MIPETSHSSEYFHVDLDAFFASVEQIDHPEWKGKPVIVGALPGVRGVVSTCSYEARTFGVRSAMPIATAYQLCPQGIYVRPRFERYSELSRQVFHILERFTPSLYRASIDEAYLDMTGTERLLGPFRQTAEALKAQVTTETGLTISVGGAPTAYLAKIASDWGKPNGLFLLESHQIDDFLEQLPLRKLHGCGTKTREILEQAGIDTTSKLRRLTLEALEILVGQAGGRFLYEASRGVAAYGERKASSHSISAETTFPEDVQNLEVLEDALFTLAHEVMFRARQEGWVSRTPHLKLRTQDFHTSSAQLTLTSEIPSADELYQQVLTLFRAKWTGQPVRLVGLGLTNLEKASAFVQTDLFEAKQRKQQLVEKAIVGLKDKNPKIPLTKARLLKNSDTP